MTRDPEFMGFRTRKLLQLKLMVQLRINVDFSTILNNTFYN